MTPGTASPSLLQLQSTIQKASLPAVWSRGIALSRTQAVQVASRASDEIICRVQSGDRSVAARVSLWVEDEDWFCDCGDRNDPCVHVAAAVLALASGSLSRAEPAPSASGYVAYRISRKQGALWLERALIFKDREEPLRDALVSVVGGIQSGRISLPPVSATSADFAVDSAIHLKNVQPIEASAIPSLLAALAECSHVTLDGSPIQASAKPISSCLEILDENNDGNDENNDENEGCRIRLARSLPCDEIFSNGAALSGGKLHALEEPTLSKEERQRLEPPGLWIPKQDLSAFVLHHLPRLEKQIRISRETSRLFPERVSLEPRIALEMNTLGAETLVVTPRLFYGNPPLAEVRDGKLELAPGARLIPDRNEAQEKAVSRKLQSELHLAVGVPTRFEGASAIAFTKKAQGWDLQGKEARSQFQARHALTPRVSLEENGKLQLSFQVEGSSESSDLARVFQAWRRGESEVPLLNGAGWAQIPTEWMERFALQLERILQSRDTHQKLPRLSLPSLVTELEELELRADIAPALLKLREKLERQEGLPPLRLPSDIRAELRHYQSVGAQWLCFLRDAGLGALLADDMGLGKTLQALCAIRGRTLIVAPTSVLFSWVDQIRQFRPALRYQLYYGPKRRLDPSVDVVLTSYPLLRLDRGLLTTSQWDTVLLDEAQTIKNPQSQVTQAAHELRAAQRLALSGTPIENHLTDLWSIFHFLNPGLLGTQTEFQDRYVSALARGDAQAARDLKRRVRPFILRRMKKEVAPELPPRTETVLHCELNTQERELYDTLLASTRKEVLLRLRESGGILMALELLLRLRQLCCHLALLPGEKAASSSKTELCLETLQSSMEQGHRTLVFSQWTSFLDLLEPALRNHNIPFLRLDGSTTNRAQVVEEFQKPSGPPVFLISLRAGGVGLTLTAADHIIILDPWWNPAVEEQAANRAHRIGQTQPVLIQRLVAKDTIEERIIELQKRKKETAAMILDEGQGLPRLTREDIESLLS